MSTSGFAPESSPLSNAQQSGAVTRRRTLRVRSGAIGNNPRPHLDRRHFLGLTGVALIAAVARSPRPAAAQAATPAAEEYVSKDGVLQATLSVSRQPIDISGTSVIATVYNGAFVGPTLRVRPGDQLRLSLVNELDEITNLHFHGLHVSPSGIADNVFIMVEPGATQDYVVDIPANHPTGTFWYHTHAHPHTESQVFGGLAGLLVVDGLVDLLPADLRDIEERAIALKDFQATDGAILTQNIDSNAPTTRTVNGEVNPALAIDAGETQLWRLANIGADIYYELQLAGHPFHVIANDGNPVWRVDAADSLVLPPGKRFDVLVQGGAPGTYELKTLAYDQQGDMYPEAVLATVTVNASTRSPAAMPEKVVEPYDLSAATVDKTRTTAFTKDQASGMFLIDGRIFDENRVDQQVQLGALEEWTVRNDNTQQHPFHIHTNDFQVMSINGTPYDAVSHQDTVNVPANGEVVIRIPFEDFTGKFVYHCHILNHADMGMMAVVEVVE